MTKFDPKQFEYHGGYLTYGTYPTPHDQRIFCGRFKYGNASKCATHLKKWLVANMTVEEYKALRAKADKWEHRDVLHDEMERRGYVQYNIGLACREDNYPVTPAGAKAMIHDQGLRRLLAGTPAIAYGQIGY